MPASRRSTAVSNAPSATNCDARAHTARRSTTPTPPTRRRSRNSPRSSNSRCAKPRRHRPPSQRASPAHRPRSARTRRRRRRRRRPSTDSTADGRQAKPLRWQRNSATSKAPAARRRQARPPRSDSPRPIVSVAARSPESAVRCATASATSPNSTCSARSDWTLRARRVPTGHLRASRSARTTPTASSPKPR